MDINNIRHYVDDRPSEGIFRVHRDAFTDPRIFEMEMKYIFERTWNFVTLEAEIPNPHDYITAHVGRTPIVITRDAKGRVGAFINACRHKGATVARLASGNAKYHVCPYHGWAYDSGGKNVDIKDRKAGCYAPAFEADNHDLIPVAKIASYRGMIFVSLSPEVPSLEDWLGDMKTFLDISIDQGPEGLEFVPGRIRYTFRANWKLQTDNALDAYHLTSAHTSFMDVIARRRKGEGNLEAQQYDWGTRGSSTGGMYAFKNGHSCTWGDHAERTKRPIWPQIGEARARVGDVRAEWMLRLRQLNVFPNMQINDAAGVILRVMRPLAVDLTEMQSYCLVAKGESQEVRARRLRQYEDFFNPGGMATPDDTVTYGDTQIGYSATGFDWIDGYARGAASITQDNALSRELGISPTASAEGGWNLFNEVGLHEPYREWARLLAAGMKGERAFK
jgi:benzoate/toluate 1,2-dioxygenase subunit alpha